MRGRLGNCAWRSGPMNAAVRIANRRVSPRRTSSLRFIGRQRSARYAIFVVQGWRFRTDDEGVFLKAPGTCVMHSTQYTPFVGVTIRPYLGHLLDVETT